MHLRAALMGLALAAIVPASRADACLAREPIARVLRRASDDLRACRERHDLPEGRYAVRLTIDPTGKVTEVAVDGSPEALGPAAESCLAAAFTRLRFETGTEGPPPAPTYDTVGGNGRRSVVPPDLRRRVSGGRGGIIVIHWPWVFRSR